MAPRRPLGGPKPCCAVKVEDLSCDIEAHLKYSPGPDTIITSTIVLEYLLTIMLALET